MSKSRLSVNLPESEIEFLKQYAKGKKLTVSELMDKWIKSLKAKTDVSPEVKQSVVNIPHDVDTQEFMTMIQ